MEEHEILYPDTDYTDLTLRWRRKTLDIFSRDKDGEIEMCLSEYDEYSTFYLDQAGIKLLIEHLQKQLI